MERLTERRGENILIKGRTSIYANEERKGAMSQNVVVRLAAYEDTGLTPEEILEADKTLKENWNIPLDRLTEAVDLIKEKDSGRSSVEKKIVHCSDCKHIYFKDFYGFCPHMVGYCRPDGFCSHAEQRFS